ncbi:MAG: hypothetical protein ACTHMJ_25135 [Thermomicrobiales bacterium]
MGVKHRLGGCLRYRHWRADTIDIHRSAESGLAYYRGLMVCGLAAVCPCCGARVAEHRCAEIQAAIDAWQGRGGQVGLITLTLPHYRSERLTDNLKALLAAYRDLGRNGPYRRLCQFAGLAHSIKSLEITWGPRNGFHPHLHILGFFAGELDASAFEQTLRRLWLGELGRLRPDLDAAAVQQHGAKFQLGFTHGAEYVSKLGRRWGLAEEVARANTKRGRGEHYTPPDLLRVVRDGEQRWAWEARRVYREYAAGVKGAHLVQFSRGLRAALGLGEEQTDEEIAGGVGQGDLLLARLSPPAWAIVRAAGDRARVRLLEIAEGGDEAATAAYVLSLAAAAGVQFAGEVVA